MGLSKEAKELIKKARDAVIKEMTKSGVTPDEWALCKEKYDKLDEMLRHRLKISPDTLLVVAGNLLGILLILNYEKADIITSKAMNFVLRGRV